MSLRNENIGLAVGIAILMVGLFVTDRNPSELAGAVIAVLGLGAAYSLSLYLNFRDGTYARPERKRRAVRR